MPRSRPRRTRIRLLATERSELQRRVAARTASQQDAYRAQIILRVAAGQTDAAIAQDIATFTRARRSTRATRPALPGSAGPAPASHSIVFDYLWERSRRQAAE